MPLRAACAEPVFYQGPHRMLRIAYASLPRKSSHRPCGSWAVEYADDDKLDNGIHAFKDSFV
eukprot:1183859-Prorocentrum_minimum.AAC.5